jgi:hypothetical protein
LAAMRLSHPEVVLSLSAFTRIFDAPSRLEAI